MPDEVGRGAGGFETLCVTTAQHLEETHRDAHAPAASALSGWWQEPVVRQPKAAGHERRVNAAVSRVERSVSLIRKLVSFCPSLSLAKTEAAHPVSRFCFIP
jgi:hypothetical protein